MGVGAELSLLIHVNDDIRFDGFQVIRNKDIRKLEPDPYAQFVETALRRRRERRPTRPRIDLRNMGGLLRSAGRHISLVALFRERIDPDVCHIGAVVHVGKRRVSLHEISPDGTWDEDLEKHSLREITRVEFGSAYEDALFVVGGKPPMVNQA